MILVFFYRQLWAMILEQASHSVGLQGSTASFVQGMQSPGFGGHTWQGSLGMSFNLQFSHLHLLTFPLHGVQSGLQDGQGLELHGFFDMMILVMMEAVMVIVMVLPKTRNPGPVPVFLPQEDEMEQRTYTMFYGWRALLRFEMFRDSDLELAA
jgi:hypothetical protein